MGLLKDLLEKLFDLNTRELILILALLAIVVIDAFSPQVNILAMLGQMFGAIGDWVMELVKAATPGG